MAGLALRKYWLKTAHIHPILTNGSYLTQHLQCLHFHSGLHRRCSSRCGRSLVRCVDRNVYSSQLTDPTSKPGLNLGGWRKEPHKVEDGATPPSSTTRKQHYSQAPACNAKYNVDEQLVRLCAPELFLHQTMGLCRVG